MSERLLPSLAEKESWMRRALQLAVRAWGETHPNPMVGAVLVEEGRVVAEGYHAAAGEPHAEVAALQALGRPPTAETLLVVTLEPCSTQGRTGPCTEAILASGIRQVLVGTLDPNPVHGGAGIRLLQEAGVSVETGILEEECRDLNLIFNHWITREAPLLAGKAALTLDGRIATRTGASQWITGDASRGDVMRWRRLFPAIAVGARTTLHDNPRLTSRRDGAEWCPVRFVFDGFLRTVRDGALPRLYTDEFRERTVVVTTSHAGSGYVRKLENCGVSVWNFDSTTPRVLWKDFRRRCAESGITGVYVEGGAHLISELIQAKELDYLFVYRAPVLFADDRAKGMFRGLRTERLEEAVRLKNVRHAAFGDDQMMRGEVHYPERLSVDETVLGHDERA